MDQIPGDAMKVIELMQSKRAEEIPAVVFDYIRTRGGSHGDAMVVKIAAPIIAEAKMTERLIAAVSALRKTGRGLTVVGVILAAIQAWPVVADWFGVAGK